MDVSERKQAELNQRLVAETLGVLNGEGDIRSRIGEVIRLIRDFTGFDAVGLRIREGVDCPYFAQTGFSDDFIKAENSLCSYPSTGVAALDASGRPVQDCSCGLVLSGRPDPRLPFFTEAGSFWTNSSRDLLELESDPRANPRNRCIQAGYQSVALIPVRSSREILGLLQLNDRHEGRLTLELVRFLEGLAGSIGIGLERSRTEAALRESETRYRLLFDGITDAVFVHGIRPDGLPGTLVAVNDVACEMLGYTREELLRLSPADIDAPESTVDPRALGERIKRGESVLFEQIHVAKDGHRIPVEINLQGVRLDGRLLILAVIRDITERKRTEAERGRLQAQLVQAQKMESVGRLAGGVAHDFNNMLQVIIGQVDIALGLSGPQGPMGESLREIRDAAHRCSLLTRQLVTFARKQVVAPRILDLNAAVTGLLRMLRPLIGEAIDLVWAPAENLWPVRMDPTQIDRMLVNLAVNARDAIAGVGRIVIATQNQVLNAQDCADHPDLPPGDYVLLSITDSGRGMTRDVLDHLFEPFYTTKEFGRGSGLGLAIVYGIVTQNNGCIQVESAVGKGTTFRIALPRAAGEPVPAPAAGTDSTPPGHGETVLLVEDEAAILRLGEAMLRRLGYTVLTAGTPGNAIRLAETHTEPIHLLIADIVMPEMNGPDLAARLATIRPGLKSLFISGYSPDASTGEGVVQDGVPFLQKPFTLESLGERVREVLGPG